MEIEILNEPYIKVIYDEDRSLVMMLWTGKASGEDYRKPFETIYDWAKSGHVITRILTDTRRQGLISTEDRKWFENKMFPRAIEGGLKRAAAVTDGNVFKRYYINAILFVINKFDIPIKIFGDRESAIEFLMSDEPGDHH